MLHKNFVYCCVLALLLSGIAGAQATASAAGVPVFKSQSKLVLVDVVVTDKSGNVVTGLKPTDFLVNEAGKPQKIRFFEEHTSQKVSPGMEIPKLPQGEYTNLPTETPKNTINIVLFDLLNTEPSQQLYARQQMLKALQNLPPGQQLALFVLGQRLQMIQGPSSDSNTLIAAARELLAVPMRQVTDAPAKMAEEDIIDSLAGQANPSWAQKDTIKKDIGAQLGNAVGKEAAAFTDDRVEFTLNSLEGIARMVSAYPGRKNLIWISGGIPFQMGADMKVDKYHRWREQRDYQQRLTHAGSLLADAQIAIYPVDLRGMAVQGVSAAVSSRSFGATGKEYYGALNDQNEEQWDNRVASTSLANETGGHAFYGSNDLADSMNSAIHMGSRYYTIAYVPTNTKMDGRYRNIDIKTNQGGVTLKYRKGYLAAPDNGANETDAKRTLVASMQLGMPASTSLLMRVKVLPPDKEHKNVRIDYAVSPDGVRFEEDASHAQKATMDFLTVAWDAKGAPVAKNSNTVGTTVQPGTAASVLRTGIPGHHEFELKPGKYLLCLGAVDRGSLKVGTVWVKLIVPNVE